MNKKKIPTPPTPPELRRIVEGVAIDPMSNHPFQMGWIHKTLWRLRRVLFARSIMKLQIPADLIGPMFWMAEQFDLTPGELIALIVTDAVKNRRPT